MGPVDDQIVALQAGPYPRWTEAERAVVVERYGAETIRQIAARLGRSVDATRQQVGAMRRAGLLALEQRYYQRPWTAVEEQELRGRWRWQRAQEIAVALRRSVRAIRTHAAVLQLGRGGPIYNATQVAELFGVDDHLVAYWIERRWLAATRLDVWCGRGYRWRISYEALERFVTETPYHFEARRMEPDSWWRRLAERASAEQRWLTCAQAARRLGVHVGTVHSHCRKGWLPAQKTTGASWQGDYRIREADLAQFQPRRRTGGPGGRGRPGMRRRTVETVAGAA